MTEQPRDWDKELAAIDREIEKQGAGPGAPGPPAALPPGAPPPPVRPTAPGAAAPAVRGAVAVTWFWVVLAVLLAAALPLWPYGKACGLQLFFYLGAAALALLAGAAGAVNSWKARRGLAHVLSLAVVVWAGVMGAAGPGEVLVSSSVRDLVAGSGFTFMDRGMHALKGVEEERRLYAVA